MAKLQKVTKKVDLPDHPGESVEIWTNFPDELFKGLIKASSDRTAQEFAIASGMLHSSTFLGQDNMPLPLAQLPWDVPLVATRAVFDYVRETQERIFEAAKAKE